MKLNKLEPVSTFLYSSNSDFLNENKTDNIQFKIIRKKNIENEKNSSDQSFELWLQNEFKAKNVTNSFGTNKVPYENRFDAEMHKSVKFLCEFWA